MTGLSNFYLATGSEPKTYGISPLHSAAVSGNNPHVMQLLERRTNSSLAITLYEAGHLRDRFRIVFTNGVARWSDADILLLGEKHVWADLTRWFVSRFVPAKPLLVCVEGSPSMRPIADQQAIKPVFFDEVHNRDVTFIGWDAPAHLMPKANDLMTHHWLLSEEHVILNEIDETSLMLAAFYKIYCSTNDVISEALGSCSLDQLKAFFNQHEKLRELRMEFVRCTQFEGCSVDYLHSVQKQSDLLIKIIEISYSLKIDHPTLWETTIDESVHNAVSYALGQVGKGLQCLHAPLMRFQAELSRGVVTNIQMRETFPDRTTALVSTIKKVGQLPTRKTVLVAGSTHLRTPEKYQAKPEFCLDALYEELRNHKVAIVVQTE